MTRCQQPCQGKTITALQGPFGMASCSMLAAVLLLEVEVFPTISRLTSLEVMLVEVTGQLHLVISLCGFVHVKIN